MLDVGFFLSIFVSSKEGERKDIYAMHCTYNIPVLGEQIWKKL